MITRDDVLHIARLARLELSEDEVEHYTEQLGAILEYIDQLNQVDTSDVESTRIVAPVHDPLRDDIEQPSLTHEQIMQNGPVVKKDSFAIPKVIGS